MEKRVTNCENALKEKIKFLGSCKTEKLQINQLVNLLLEEIGRKNDEVEAKKPKQQNALSCQN